jgi:hypothetical protein
MRTTFGRLFGFGRDGAGDAEDAWIGRALGTLDPAGSDPGFWTAFQQTVMRAAGPELAQRRRLASLTVSDVVFSWSRMLVPAALVAAMAAFVLMRPQGVDPRPLRLEEVLMQGAELTASDMSDELVGEISFAVEVY